MNDLAAPFRQLIERRLWPLALILLAALAAVFLVLSKGEEPAPTPLASSSASGTTATAAATTPIVSLGDAASRDERRKVLGARKNPFKPTIRAKKAKAGTATTTAKAAAPTAAGGSLLPKTDQALSDAINDITGGSTIPGEKPKVYETYSLFVRFGAVSDTQALTGITNVRRLKALPTVADPVVIYLGLLDDQKTAVFLVDDGVKVQGDGRCRPDPLNCQTVHLRRGETSFFDVIGENGEVSERYQLDLVKIKTKKTSDAAAARAARKAEAEGGRDALRAHQSRVGNLRYDSGSGLVRELE